MTLIFSWPRLVICGELTPALTPYIISICTVDLITQIFLISILDNLQCSFYLVCVGQAQRCSDEEQTQNQMFNHLL